MPDAPTATPPPATGAHPPAAPAGPPPALVRPAAPPRVQLAVVATGAVAVVALPGGRLGVGVLLLAAVVAAVVSAVRAPGQRRSRWQWAHGSCAVLLAASPAVRDAPWLVALDLLAALALATLALAPATTWPAVLLAPLRPLARTPTATAWLLRGALQAARSVRARWRTSRPAGAPGAGSAAGPHRLAPVLRGGALTAVLLAVFVPLLTSADARFGGVLAGAWTRWGAAASWVAGLLDPGRPAALLAHALVFAASAVAVGAGLVVAGDARSAPSAPSARPAGDEDGERRRPVLARRVEWLLPLGALDALFAVFLLVRATGAEPSATLAAQVHAGFGQLVAATGLVLAVVALAARWTPMTTGPRAALGALCLLSLGLDAAALTDLHAYVGAYGWTRLRLGVAVICAGLAALLVLLLVAGGLGRARAPQRRAPAWVAHAAVLVVAGCLVALTAADPDAVVARSQLARLEDRSVQGSSVQDASGLASLSADAVPALAAALGAGPGVLGARGPCLVADLAGARSPGSGGWASANLSRARARRLAARLPACTRS